MKQSIQNKLHDAEYEAHEEIDRLTIRRLYLACPKSRRIVEAQLSEYKTFVANISQFLRR